MSACSTKSTTSPSEGKMERNLSNPWGPHHIRTWVPIFTPAHLRTWPTVYLYPGDREGQLGVQSCQQPSETLKLVRLMWTIPVSQSQSMVPWTVRRNYWPSCYRSEDPNVTAMSEAVRAKLGITEPLPKPALASPSSGWSTLADDLKRSRVSRLLPEVTCPSFFHPRTRTVAIAELQDVPVTETEIKGLTALAALAGRPPPSSNPTSGGGKSGKPIAQANIQLELPELDPKNLPERAEEFAEFFLLTRQSHADVATKCSLFKCSCKKKFLQKPVKQIVKTCSTWAEVLQRFEKTFAVYETDLKVRPQIEELPMLPEFPSAARVSEYVCDLEYLFSRLKVGSYGPRERHLWLVSNVPTRT